MKKITSEQDWFHSQTGVTQFSRAQLSGGLCYKNLIPSRAQPFPLSFVEPIQIISQFGNFAIILSNAFKLTL